MRKLPRFFVITQQGCELVAACVSESLAVVSFRLRLTADEDLGIPASMLRQTYVCCHVLCLCVTILLWR